MLYAPCGTRETIAAAQQVIRDGTFLKTGKGGYIRLFIPAECMPFKPGSALAKAFGLWKYNGKKFGNGFVLTTDFPERDLERCFADPPPLKWSAAMFRKRRIHDGKQATQARGNCHEVTTG